VIVLVLLVVWLVVLVVQRAGAGAVTTAGVPVPWTPTVVRRVPRAWPAVRALGLVEGRRLLTHPLVLAGAGLGVFATGFGEDSTARYLELTGAGRSALYLPMLVLFAAHLNATRARRADADDLVGAAALSPAGRTLASCLAGALTAGVVLVALLVALLAYRVLGVEPVRWPGPFELLALPLSLLGAATLGTMLARWLPWRGILPPVLVLLVGVSIALDSDKGEQMRLFGCFVNLIDSDGPRLLTSLPLHLTAGHAGYLAGLAAMATVGAVLRDTRSRAWWALGAAAVLWTAAMGVWQVS
jgi:hypothetical protein